jgi:hypothetical protein
MEETYNMSTSQANWAFCINLFPIFYSTWSIRRGWNILKHNKMSLDFPFMINSLIIRIFRGEERSSEYEDNMLANQGIMKQTGWFSFIGGIIVLLICLVWSYSLIVQY